MLYLVGILDRLVLKELISQEGNDNKVSSLGPAVIRQIPEKQWGTWNRWGLDLAEGEYHRPILVTIVLKEKKPHDIC